MKNKFYIVMLLIILTCSITPAQEWHTASLEAYLLEYGIDAENIEQVLDSLSSPNENVRYWCVLYCGRNKIQEALPIIKNRLEITEFDWTLNKKNSVNERMVILESLIAFEDSSIHDELKEGILYLKDSANEVNQLLQLSSYLMSKFNDDYGWQFIKPYLEDDSLSNNIAGLYYLEPFSNSQYSEELHEIIRRLAVEDTFLYDRRWCLEHLYKVNYPGVEDLAFQLANSDSSQYVRSAARAVLRKIDSPFYLSTLYNVSNSEKSERLRKYEELLKTRMPIAHKFVVDTYNENRDPQNNLLLKSYLENPFNYWPSSNSFTIELIDSLISANTQFINFNWLGDNSYLLMLDNHLSMAKDFFGSGDSVNFIKEIKNYSNIIDKGFRGAISNAFVTIDAWNYLYYSAQGIIEIYTQKEITNTLFRVVPESIGPINDSLTISIYGTGFCRTTEVYWNDKRRETFVLSDSVVSAKILPSDLQVIGEHNISVYNQVSNYLNTLSFNVIQYDQFLRVKLIDSQGNLLQGGSLQYYDGSWKDAVNNGDGTFNVITERTTVSIRMTYEGGNQQLNNVTVGPDTAVFQTVNTTVKLLNSLNEPLADLSADGTVQFYAGSWREFGTIVNGTASKELLPRQYTFRMTYGGANNDKQQNIGTDPVVVFQTVNSTVQLLDSQGNLIQEEGIVQYYAGSWRTFGTTTSGTVSKELLPKNYSFRMTHEGVNNDKQQDIGVEDTVSFSTVFCVVQVKDSQNQPVDGAEVKYYSGSWRDIGLTANGEVNKELLPKNLTFRVIHNGVVQNKQQDIGTNNTVEFVVE